MSLVFANASMYSDKLIADPPRRAIVPPVDSTTTSGRFLVLNSSAPTKTNYAELTRFQRRILRTPPCPTY